MKVDVIFTDPAVKTISLGDLFDANLLAALTCDYIDVPIAGEGFEMVHVVKRIYHPFHNEARIVAER